jgi:hypothetical protein
MSRVVGRLLVLVVACEPLEDWRQPRLLGDSRLNGDRVRLAGAAIVTNANGSSLGWSARVSERVDRGRANKKLTTSATSRK